MSVPVEIEIVDGAPALDFGAWDHVAEASLDLPSGRLEIHQCTDGSVDILAVAPGPYRVQAPFRGPRHLEQGRARRRRPLPPRPLAGAERRDRDAQAV